MKIYSLMIIVAGAFWGTSGIFAKELANFGFDSVKSAAARLSVGAIIILIAQFKNLKVKLNDLWIFAILGIGSLFAMNFVYYEAMRHTSLSIASILLYTAPIMVTVMSAIFYKEKLTRAKISALVISFLGIILVSGFDSNDSASALGICLGLMSGLAYSLYSIIGKFALKKYPPLVIAAYAFIFAAIAAITCSNPPKLFALVFNTDEKLMLTAFILGSGAITAAIPYMLYTVALKFVPAGKASVMASVEPLTATLVGIAFYNESFTATSAIGMLLILASVASLGLISSK